MDNFFYVETGDRVILEHVLDEGQPEFALVRGPHKVVGRSHWNLRLANGLELDRRTGHGCVFAGCFVKIASVERAPKQPMAGVRTADSSRISDYSKTT